MYSRAPEAFYYGNWIQYIIVKNFNTEIGVNLSNLSKFKDEQVEQRYRSGTVQLYQYVRGILKNSNLVGVGGWERTPLGPSIRPFPTVSVYERSNSHA